MISAKLFILLPVSPLCGCYMSYTDLQEEGTSVRKEVTSCRIVSTVLGKLLWKTLMACFHSLMVSLFHPPFSPFLNPTEELFSSSRWKVYDHQPHDQMFLLDAMNAGCRHICRCLPGMNQTCWKILSQAGCRRGQKVWCGWKLVAKRRRQDWLALLSFYIYSYPIHVCIVNSFVLHYWNYFRVILWTSNYSA